RGARPGPPLGDRRRWRAARLPAPGPRTARRARAPCAAAERRRVLPLRPAPPCGSGRDAQSRAGLTLPERLAESLADPGRAVPEATGRGVDEECRPVYRGLYFTLARDEDVEILGWLLAIPRSRRMRAIKAVLRTGLPAYATARYPELTPLPPDTVRAAL